MLRNSGVLYAEIYRNDFYLVCFLKNENPQQFIVLSVFLNFNVNDGLFSPIAREAEMRNSLLSQILDQGARARRKFCL